MWMHERGERGAFGKEEEGEGKRGGKFIVVENGERLLRSESHDSCPGEAGPNVPGSKFANSSPVYNGKEHADPVRDPLLELDPPNAVLDLDSHNYPIVH